MAFQRVVVCGLFHGITIDSSFGFRLSHIFYVDDAIFLGELKDLNIKNIVRMLHCFFLASVLKINLNKSKILGFGVPSI